METKQRGVAVQGIRERMVLISLSGGQLAPPQITYDFSVPPPAPHHGNNYRPNTLPPGGMGHFQVAYGLGFPEPKLSKTRPLNNLAGSGYVKRLKVEYDRVRFGSIFNST